MKNPWDSHGPSHGNSRIPRDTVGKTNSLIGSVESATTNVTVSDLKLSWALPSACLQEKDIPGFMHQEYTTSRYDMMLYTEYYTPEYIK